MVSPPVDFLPPVFVKAAFFVPAAVKTLLRCLGHGVRGVVVFVLIGGSSGVIVLVARAAVIVARAVAVVVVVVVYNL